MSLIGVSRCVYSSGKRLTIDTALRIWKVRQST